MSVLAVVTAATSLVAMTPLVDRFRAAAVHLDRETATATRLRSTVEEEFNLAHGVIDRRPGGAMAFTRLDGAVRADLARAPRAYGRAAELELVARMRAQWTIGLALPRRLAGGRGPAGAPDRARDIRTHEALHGHPPQLRATFGELEEQIRVAHRSRLEAGGTSRDRFLLVLLATALASIAALIVFARRMAREVLAPIRQLREAWQLGAGETVPRVTPQR